MKYIKQLDELYNRFSLESNQDSNKLFFIGDYIFDFTTYCDGITEIMATNMLEVIDKIHKKTTFEYITDDNNHLNFILMCNMPFLIGKLNWGTSIRGCWFDNNESYTTHNGEIVISRNEIDDFMSELLEWYKI